MYMCLYSYIQFVEHMFISSYVLVPLFSTFYLILCTIGRECKAKIAAKCLKIITVKRTHNVVASTTYENDDYVRIVKNPTDRWVFEPAIFCSNVTCDDHCA
jgi:hypothetical protein